MAPASGAPAPVDMASVNTASVNAPPLRPAPEGRDLRRASETDVWLEATEAVRQALRPPSPLSQLDRIVAGRPIIAGRPKTWDGRSHEAATGGAGDRAALLPPFRSEGEETDARDLDDRLCRLTRISRALDAGIGLMLLVIRRHALHRDLGEPCFETWGRLALGLDPAATAPRLSFHAGLARLGALSQAYRSGRLTRLQATLVLGLAGSRDVGMWVRWAERTSLGRLRCAAATRSGPHRSLEGRDSDRP